jgi:hypothetical protein
VARLTPDEQANVDAGLTIDGRPIEPCPHDDEWDSTVAAATTGEWENYSYLDDEED